MASYPAACVVFKVSGFLTVKAMLTMFHWTALSTPMYAILQLPLKLMIQADLLLWTHDEIMQQGCEADLCTTAADAEHLSKESGVKGLPLLSHVQGLQFPLSFPFDFMHKNLILFWTGEFKQLDEGSGSYVPCPKVWDAIGTATALSGSTIPYAFGASLLNVAVDQSACTADMWSFCTLYLGPILLRCQFSGEKYYHHFIDLVWLLNICLQFECAKQDIDIVHAGFIAWVLKYEEYVLAFALLFTS
jgi:hypothetical protein